MFVLDWSGYPCTFGLNGPGSLVVWVFVPDWYPSTFGLTGPGLLLCLGVCALLFRVSLLF